MTPYPDNSPEQSKPSGDYTGILFHQTIRKVTQERNLIDSIDSNSCGNRANYVYSKMGTRKPKTSY
jgi:hypothetical protein